MSNEVRLQPKAQNANVSRRAFLKGAAAAAVGIAAVEGGFEFVYPEGAFADENAPEVKKHTYCDMCNHTPKCGITATVKEDKIVRVESRAKYPNSPLCAKGISSLQELYDPHRLLYPMKRTKPKGQGDAGWEQIAWDEAYDTIVAAMNKVK
ncbi:MAG: twin-arginine translocation signal domain-containing protein, partial [Raoultibacter sp.]